jgi:hypothetical protein
MAQQMNETPVLCKDCKYYTNPYVYGRCSHPQNTMGKINLETGECKSSYAEIERMPDRNCGPEGKLFEPKEINWSFPIGPVIFLISWLCLFYALYQN